VSKEKRHTGPQLETYLKRRVESDGGRCLKFVSPGLRGMPDRIVLWPSGTVEFVEVKGSGDRMRPAQRRAHEMLREMEFRVYTVSSVGDINEFIDGVPG
jgi:hypothetical protein